MEQWIPTIVAVLGSFISGYLGVRIAVAKLEVQMVDVRAEIKILRDRSHEHTNALLKLDGRLTAMEDRMDER